MLNLGLRVRVLDGRQTLLQIATGCASVSALRYELKKRVDGTCRVGEIGRAYQAVRADILLTGEMMEHEHPLTPTRRPHFEASAIRRERIDAMLPRTIVAGHRLIGIVLAV